MLLYRLFQRSCRTTLILSATSLLLVWLADINYGLFPAWYYRRSLVTSSRRQTFMLKLRKEIGGMPRISSISTLPGAVSSNAWLLFPCSGKSVILKSSHNSSGLSKKAWEELRWSWLCAPLISKQSSRRGRDKSTSLRILWKQGLRPNAIRFRLRPTQMFMLKFLRSMSSGQQRAWLGMLPAVV